MCDKIGYVLGDFGTTMMMPAQILLVPQYLWYEKLG